MTANGAGSRQSLSFLQRERAARAQIFDSPRQSLPYRVPFGRTPDEQSYNNVDPRRGGFPRFAASFNKLLEHDRETGVLTTRPGVACAGHRRSGVQNYEQLLAGLSIDEPSSDFNTEALNGLELCNRDIPEPLRPRVLVNPRSSKALAIKGPDITSLRVSQIIKGFDKKRPTERDVLRDERELLETISLGSAETAAEMLELYAMALLRSAPLGSYDKQPAAEAIIRTLNRFADKFVWGYHPNGSPITAASRPITPENLFRGPTAGDLAGDYLSVFLTFERPPIFPSGCAAFVADLIEAGKFADLLGEPLLVPLGKDLYFGVTRKHYTRIQNAEVPQPYPDGFFTRRVPISTGLDLGNYVHVDNVYEEYIRAADILTGGRYQLSPLSPYTGDPSDSPPPPFYRNESDGPTLGPSDAYAILGGVREVAERAAFTQKWLVARRARPEVLAGLIDLANRPMGDLDPSENELRQQVRRRLSPHLVLPDQPNSDTEIQEDVRAVLDRIRRDNREQQERWGYRTEENLLLSQVYPEGSPAHPAWTSGHATVAGACVTVLKASFDDRQCIINPDAKPDAPAEEKCYRPAPSGPTLTVGGELDKLASNIALGRNFGGVHYRTDGEHGILLGEEVAIRYLQDHLREYREEFRKCSGAAHEGFQLTKRNGQRICITPDEVHPLSP
ncbi:MAG: hypothetical protein LC808_01935 [Actinobacteria bacterium]|nr:hypothetical protein [Actinomycetota bacterium]